MFVVVDCDVSVDSYVEKELDNTAMDCKLVDYIVDEVDIEV